MSKKLTDKSSIGEFQKASIPFETADDANHAAQEFWNEVYELRIKYKIANVSFIIEDQVAGSGVFLATGHIGEASKEETMAAWHFGQASATRQEMVREMVSIGSKQAINGLAHE